MPRFAQKDRGIILYGGRQRDIINANSTLTRIQHCLSPLHHTKCRFLGNIKNSALNPLSAPPSALAGIRLNELFFTHARVNHNVSNISPVIGFKRLKIGKDLREYREFSMNFVIWKS